MRAGQRARRSVERGQFITIGATGLATGLALVASRSPLLAVAFALTFVVGYLLFFKTGELLVILVLSDVIRWAAIGPEFSRVFYAQKALTLVAILVLLTRTRQTRAPLGWPMLGYLSVGVMLTFYASDILPGVNAVQTIESAVTLSLGWFAACLVLTPTHTHRLLIAMAVSPALSMLIGLGLGLEVYAADYTGASRLAGATIPAYFAFLTVLGTIAVVLLARSNPRWWGLMAVNLGLALLSGTRGAVLCLILVLTPEVVRLLLDLRRSSISRGINAGVASGAIGVGAAVFIPIVIQRSDVGGAFSSSGRSEAWRFFLDLASSNPLFGRGIGAGPVAADYKPSDIYGAFLAQHSEYVRAILETGYVGLGIFIVAVLTVFGRVIAVQDRTNRPLAVGLMLGVLVYSGTDNTFTDFQFAVPLGLILATMWKGGKGLPPEQPLDTHLTQPLRIKT